MPTQQRFEGPDLEVLLDEVRSIHGDDVNIVEANKIRKGGMGGFFARELFEIVIDTDEPGHGAGRPTTLSAPTTSSILDLVDQVDDGFSPSGETLASAGTVADLMAATEEPPVIEDLPEGKTTIQALLDRVHEARTEEPAVVRPDATTLSTDRDAFADVLGRITASSQQLPPSEPEAPFRSFAEAAPRAERPTMATATATAQPTATNEPTMAAQPTPTASPARTTPTSVEASASPVRGQRIARPAVPSGIAQGDLVDPLLLGRLGLPAPYLEAPLDARDRLSALLQLAEQFPRPRALPRAGGEIIVLVGDRSGVQPAVSWACQELDVEPDSLLLASRRYTTIFPESRRLATKEEAGHRRLSVRRRPTPTLVVVDEAVGRLRTPWAREIVDALEPTAVWGVVDAGRKAEDVSDWCEALGGVDALAVHGTEHTSSPASVLTTGLPVGLIDGKPATPARWAAVLDERLAAA